MNEQEIQEIANELKLDVRPFANNHFRLLDSQGNYIIDIYIRRKRNGEIIRNSFLLWKTNTWGVLRDKQHLINLL